MSKKRRLGADTGVDAAAVASAAAAAVMIDA
jgi:hypothetical protein